MVHPRMYTVRMARVKTVLPVTRVVEERPSTKSSYITRLAAARNTYLSRVGTTDTTPYTLGELPRNRNPDEPVSRS